ncbi:putative protein [Arabidopsis thaliana]|uniref:Uncharacterized protein F14L2_20 n=1 Tax=Arabidopsis thaliana TaxID=3702 RepID=Q9LXP0_ARATH|nr:putative protein [Arabidopsis thaliana]
MTWEFELDIDLGASLVLIDEHITYHALVDILVEDFQIDSSTNSLKLSYKLVSTSTTIQSHPLYIRNDRQLATFMHKFSQSGGLLQLCLTVEQISVTVEQAETTSNPFVSHSVPNAQAETTSNPFASHSASTTQID